MEVNVNEETKLLVARDSTTHVVQNICVNNESHFSYLGGGFGELI